MGPRLVAAALALCAGCASGPRGGAGAPGAGGHGATGAGATGGSSGGRGGAGRLSSGFAVGSDHPEGTVATLRLADAETGATYDAVGRPADGGGDELSPLAGYNQFWFAWSVWNDGSEVFGHDEPVRTRPLAGDGECAVPCSEILLGCPGKDCIPALTAEPLRTPESTGVAVQVDPRDGGAAYLTDNSFVVGLAVDGDVRAYPHNVLWWHEVVNDVVGGSPIGITHCPLTFSSIAHDLTGFGTGEVAELGVSGRLFNSNLVFYDRIDDTWYNQLLGVGTKGPALRRPAPRIHAWEMTWAAWRALHPESTVLSQDTGHARSYTRYPYGSYFVDDADTFRPTDPAPDPAVPNKALTYGVRVGGAAKAYVHDDLAAWARDTYGPDAPPAGVVNDVVGGKKIAVVFDVDAGYVQAFDRAGAADLELAR